MNTKDLEFKREELIRIRNRLSEVFNKSKEDWGKEWIKQLSTVCGDLDVCILKLGRVIK